MISTGTAEETKLQSRHKHIYIYRYVKQSTFIMSEAYVCTYLQQGTDTYSKISVMARITFRAYQISNHKIPENT